MQIKSRNKTESEINRSMCKSKSTWENLWDRGDLKGETTKLNMKQIEDLWWK